MWQCRALEMQESQAWNVAKSAAAAAAVSLMLSASPVEAKEDNAFLSFPDNEAGEAVSLLHTLTACFVVGGRGIAGIGCVTPHRPEGMLLCVHECAA